MLQIALKTYASDALEDAMRLSETKALNSYNWSDCLETLNYEWSDLYNQLALVDEGFYSLTMRLTSKETKLPAFVKNTVKVYAAQSQNTYNRQKFRESGMNDLQGYGTFHISGFDLYCPDAERRTVWMNYVPQPKQLFFTRNNRDPKIYETFVPVSSMTYNMYTLEYDASIGKYLMVYRNRNQPEFDCDITDILVTMHPDWSLRYITCDFPYIFVTYQHNITGEYLSGFYRNLPHNEEFIEYNPFAYTGRNSNVEYLKCKWNDKTGMGVVVKDHNDFDELGNPRIKELGWTPDSLITYPTPEMYRLLVARLADKFAALNESTVMVVARELEKAESAFKNFTGKQKAAWRRIDNVNGPNIGDWM